MKNEPQKTDASFSELLEKNPDLRRILSEQGRALPNIYEYYFRHALNFSETDAQTHAQKAIRNGIPVIVKSMHGEITALFSAPIFIADSYFGALCASIGRKLGQPVGYAESIDLATAEDREYGEQAATLFLAEMVSILHQEMHGTLEDSWKLLRIKLRKAISDPNLNLRDEIERVALESTRRRKQQAGVERGGARARAGFKWDKASEIAFRETVDRNPKIKGISIWQFACEELIENEFDVDTVRWLLSHPGFEDVDPHLFHEAVKCWRKYDEPGEITVTTDSPRHFEYRQALTKLGIPDKYAFSSLNNHYFAGRSKTKVSK